MCYFDGLSRPLTIMEIYRWLGQRADFSELFLALGGENLRRVIGQENGFYFLAGGEDSATKRLSRYAVSAVKMKKALRMAKIFKWFPWVKAIAVYSSLSFFNSEKESDIDFFVIAAKGRVWSARFFLNSFLKIFNLRPDERTSEDKFCLSFLVDEDSLDLGPAIDGENDFHYIASHSQFVFLLGDDDLISRFFGNNRHIMNSFPNWQPYWFGDKISFSEHWLKNAMEIFFGLFLEKFYRRVQFLILPARAKEAAGSGKAVILSEKMIKLHYNDKRQIFNDKFRQNFKQIINAFQN